MGWRISLLLSVLLVVWSCCQFQPVTPYGVQCPNAPVQRVAVATGKCVCAKARAPKPGDKDFVQCRCSEKRSAQTKLSSAPKPQLFVAARLETQGLSLPIDGAAIGYDTQRYLSPNPAPLAHPPACV